MKKHVGILLTLTIIIALFLGTVTASAQNLIVVLDPGHGGNDTGAGSSYGGKTYNESEINLKIAKAAKKYLEEYKGVTVYMTREDNNKSLTNAQRVAFASKVGANFLLSIHCNDAEGSPTTKGALAIASWSTAFEAKAAEKTRDVGSKILNNYAKVGLSNKGLYLKRATEVDRDYKVFYPDGTEQDYYGMTQRALRIGMPCTLMETGFVSSPDDMKILSSDSKTDELGKACASGIAESYGLSKSEAVNAPETHPVDGANISFTTPYACKLIYAYTGSGVKSNGSYAEINGDGAGKVIAYLDYMGMSLTAKDYSKMTITMKAGSSCKVDVYVSSSKQWNHENVVSAGNKVTFNLTDEFQDYTINLANLPVWDTALNYVEFYVTGSEYLMIKQIKASYEGSEKQPTLKPASTVAPTTAPTKAPTEAPTATQVPTAAPTEAPLETEKVTEAPTEVPTETPSVTVSPTDVHTPEATMAPENDEPKSKGGSSKTIITVLAICIVLLAALAIFMMRKR